VVLLGGGFIRTKGSWEDNVTFRSIAQRKEARGLLGAGIAGRGRSFVGSQSRTAKVGIGLRGPEEKERERQE